MTSDLHMDPWIPPASDKGHLAIPPIIASRPEVNVKVEPTSAVEQTLSERGSRYGDFADNAELSQKLETIIYSMPGCGKLEPLHREALKFIFQKISRIVNGDPNYADNWHDIQGYAKLVEDRLPK